jgi:hypothetical protein
VGPQLASALVMDTTGRSEAIGARLGGRPALVYVLRAFT